MPSATTILLFYYSTVLLSEYHCKEQMYVYGFFFLLYHHQLFSPHFYKIRTTAVLLSHLCSLCWWYLFIAIKHDLFYFFLHIQIGDCTIKLLV